MKRCDGNGKTNSRSREKVKQLATDMNNLAQRIGAEGKSLIEVLNKSQDKNANGGYSGPDAIDDKL